MESHISYSRKFNYFHFSGLLQNFNFKKLYQERCNVVFEKNGKRLGIWKLGKNGYYGILDLKNTWCWRNTVNTHPYCFHDLYYLLYDMTGIELNFNNESKWLESINILWEFVDKNFDLFFTENVESNIFNQFRLRTNKSWSQGQITTIAVGYKLRELFDDCEISSLYFNIERGCVDDFRGKDIVFSNKCNEKISLQIKMGSIVNETDDGYEVKSSVNDLKAKCEYYSFVDIDTHKNITTISLFQNPFDKTRYIKLMDNRNFFYKKEILHKIIKENMEVPQILMLIAQYSFQNKIVFDLRNEQGQKNNIVWNDSPEKILEITIGDFKDKNLGNYLTEEFEKLKEFFNKVPTK